MKKSLLSLALVSAFAAPAFAQNVQIYGAVDAGVENVRTGGVSTTTVGSGLTGGSHLGFRGTETLGGGLKADFVLESGVSLDTGANTQGTFFGRQAWVGVSDSSMGGVRLGHQYTPLRWINVELDPFGRAGSGNSANILGGGGMVERTSNAVTYVLPNMHGFGMQAQYGFGETAGSTDSNRFWGLNARYSTGPLTVALGYSDRNTNAVGVDSNRTDTQVGGTYDFGVAKGFASYVESRAKDNVAVTTTKNTGYLLGVSMPMGPHTLMASWASNKVDGVANSTSNQLAVGYAYALSKRTNVYGSYANVDNDLNAKLAGSSANGNNVNRFQVGLRHTF